jgi:hypothetical protein
MRDQQHMTVGCRPSRNRSPVWQLAAAATSLALLLAGCTTSALHRAAPVPDAPAASPSTATSVPLPSDAPLEPADAVVWLDGFCGAVGDFLADNNAARGPASISSDEGQHVFSTMLGDYAAILGKAIDRLAALPPISDPVGQTAKQTFVANYTSARDTATSAKAQLDTASPTDFGAQTRATEQIIAVQQRALSAVSPEIAIMTSPELRAALASAHRCTSTS